MIVNPVAEDNKLEQNEMKESEEHKVLVLLAQLFHLPIWGQTTRALR